MKYIPRTLKDKIKRNSFAKQLFRTVKLKRELVFPSRVEIETTSFCNARCNHCEHSTLGRPRAHMEMGLYKKIIDECDQYKKYCKEVFLFWMGEPFLDPNFFEKVKYAKQKNSFKVTSYSNGSLLTSGNCQKLIESGLDSIVFGTDGATKNSYESIRTGLSYDRMVDGIKRLADLKRKLGTKTPHIHVQMVLTPLNYQEVGLFNKTWAGIVDEISIRKLVVWSGDTIDDELMDYSRTLIGERYSQSIPCLFPWSLMVIAQDGKVALCCTDSRVKYELGDLSKESVQQIWRGQKMTQLRETHLAGQMNEIPICNTCNHRQILEYPWWWYS